MTKHTGHNHPATPAGRAACRKAMAAGTPVVVTPRARLINEPTIVTPVGKIRAGSVIIASDRGFSGRSSQHTVLEVSDDIKNGYAGWVADGRWGYDDQVLRIVKF